MPASATSQPCASTPAGSGGAPPADDHARGCPAPPRRRCCRRARCPAAGGRDRARSASAPTGRPSAGRRRPAAGAPPSTGRASSARQAAQRAAPRPLRRPLPCGGRYSSGAARACAAAFATIASQSAPGPREPRGPAVSVPRSCADRGRAPRADDGTGTLNTHRDAPRHDRRRPPREEIVLRRARMMKAAALLLAGSMALAACASDEKSGGSAASSSGSSGSGDLKIGLAYDTGGRGDKSFNDSAYAGVEAAIKEHGGKVSELSPERRRLQPRRPADPAGRPGLQPDHRRRLRLRRRRRRRSPRSTPTPASRSSTPRSPTTGLDNLTGLLFAANEGSFLAGVAAALKTDDRPHRLRRWRRHPADPEVRGGLRRRAPRRSSRTSRSTSSTSRRTVTSPGSTTRPRARSSPRACTTAAPTSSTTRPAARVSASSRRPPPRASARSASTPTSTRPSTTRPCRP